MPTYTNRRTGHVVTADAGSRVDRRLASIPHLWDAADDDDRPAKSDAKAVWLDYAVAQGADRDEAEAATKADLVDRYS
jgi:hypothetical protein